MLQTQTINGQTQGVSVVVKHGVQVGDIHRFTVIHFSLHGFITNQKNEQLPFLWIVISVGRAQHWYIRSHEFVEFRPGFFQPLFSPLLKYSSSLQRSLSSLLI